MKKVTAIILCVMIMISLAPAFSLPVAAESADIGRMNALDALGIDTSKMPDGYDPNSTSNPYGQNSVTVNPVYELFVSKTTKTAGTPLVEGTTTTATDTYVKSTSIFGHNKPLNQGMDVFYNNQGTSISNNYSNITVTDSGDSSKNSTTINMEAAATASASGNFTGVSQAGKKMQVVTVAAGELSKNGGLYMYFTNPVTGDTGDIKTLQNTTGIIGNSGSKMDEDFATSPYLMQNYLKVTSGDYDNDGVDEVAVYVPEQGKSRVEIYKLQITSSSQADAYLTTGNWVKSWTYYFNESPYVSNMVSLTSGDFTRDGTDDIALTWGYYYGPDSNNACQAVVLYGGSSNMFQISRKISLSYNNTSVVRAAFAYGDIDGDNVNDLVLGGELSSDIAAGNGNSRFVAVYNYDGTTDSFLQNTAVNFDLFHKENSQYVNTAMATHGDKFYSIPACVTNIATVNMNGVGKASYIYLDSLFIENGNSGLTIVTALDQNSSFNKNNGRAQTYYAEYGVVSADFTGLGKETLQVMQCYTPVVTYSTETRYLNWLYQLFNISYSVTTATQHPADIDMLAVYGNTSGISVKRTDDANSSTSFCKANTDNDTSLLSYTGKHFVRYTDPKVLAAIASPPYFSDLDNDALSSTYKQSETSYSSTTGSGSESSNSNTLNIGAYVNFEHDFSVFGVKVASVEAELAYQHGWTWETSKSSMLEQSISYSTGAGQDAVAFYSIPMEIYVYKSLVPIIDEASGDITGYDTQYMSVNIPHTASVKVLSTDTYEKIAADYPDTLPQIAGTVFRHTIGNPATYPKNTNGYNSVTAYNGTPSGVGFGIGSMTQGIAMSSETSNSFTNTNTIDIKAGAGAGDFVFGVSAGYEHGASTAKITTSGSSFEGKIYNMPEDAEQYGYGFSWTLFSYEYNDGKSVFPVVDYVVSDVSAPPRLPEDFTQDIDGTTDKQVKLTWSYNGTCAGFQIYRYYEFPDGSGSNELAFVPAAAVIGTDSTGKKYFQYVDTGLDPYMPYDYQIQVIGTTQPAKSELSPVYTAKTKIGIGYPDISISGLETNDSLLVYPDTNSKVTVNISNMSDYTQTPRYQWQKLSDHGWADISGATSSSYIFSSAGLSDEGRYRCRVNAIYQSYYLSAYSDEFTVNYSKRTPVVITDSFTAVDTTTTGGELVPKFSINLKSLQDDNISIPQGNVTFDVVGADYNSSFTVALGTTQIVSPSDSSKNIIVASASYTLDKPLPDGAYEISAYFEGSRVFKSMTTAVPVTYLAGNNSGYLMTLDSSYTYGDQITPSLKSVEKLNGETTSTNVVSNVIYKVIKYSVQYVTDSSLPYLFSTKLVPTEIASFNGGEATSTVEAGSYTLAAYLDNVLDTEGNPIEIASKEFTVNKRNITIGINDQNAVAGTSGLSHPTDSILKLVDGSFGNSDMIAGLGLAVQATNSAGTVVAVNGTTDPGSYTIIGTAGNTNGTRYNDYNITFTSGTYILTGPKYSVTGAANTLNGKSVGAIQLLSPTGNDNTGWTTRYSGATTLVFKAAPNMGYTVKDWRITNSTGTTITNSSSTTLVYTMTNEPVSVAVDFEVAQNKLTYEASIGSGTVVCTSNESMYSGAVAKTGAEFAFMATPAEGYHFVEWQLMEIGKTTTNPAGTLGNDGTDTCDITMGSATTILYAVFARNNYILTLTNNNLQASYTTKNKLTNADETVTVYNGALIPGDKVVTVSPKPGFAIASDSGWSQDGVSPASGVSADSQSYVFTMLAGTAIGANLENKHYGVTVTVDNLGCQDNTVSSTVNGLPVQDLSNIAGGSKLAFTATPAYGYVFDKWIVTGASSVASGNKLSISALSADTAIEAVFKNNAAYTVTLKVGQRGSLKYSLNGGAIVDASDGTAIPVFNGDSIVLTASPESSFMVDNWSINDNLLQTNSKTETLANIGENTSVEVSFVAQTYSTVSYSVSSDVTSGGGTVTAQADNVDFDSGSNSIGNGCKLVFTAVPDSGKIVDKWTLNDVVVSNTTGSNLVDTIYTIPSLSKNAVIVVYFKDIVTHTVTISDTNTDTVVSYSPEFSVNARDGATATFVVTPQPGFRISEVSVSGNAGATGLNGFDSISEQADGRWICIVNAVTSDLALVSQAENMYNIAVPVAPVGGKILLSTDTAIVNEPVTITATADVSHIFESWTVTDEGGNELLDVVSAKSAVTTFSMPPSNVTVSAVFKASGNNNGNNNGSYTGGSFVTPSDPVVTTSKDISGNGTITTARTSVAGTADPDSYRVAGKITSDTMDALIREAGKAETAGEKAVIELSMNIVTGTKEAEITIPSSSFNSMAGTTNADVKFATSLGTLTFSASAVDSISKSASGDVSISMAKVDISSLPDNMKQVVGDRPVYGFSVTAGGNTISTFGTGYVTVSLPYTPKVGEDTNAIVIYYIDASGKLQTMNGKYDEAIGSVRFETTHFSEYMIGYNKVSFKDVRNTAWYSNAVSFITARGIASGTASELFSPDAVLTRGQFVVMLMNAYGLSPLSNASDNFKDAGSTYYTEYLASAKKLGIINGTGDNSFSPNSNISRQDMFTILYRALDMLGKLPSATTDKELESFSDSGNIASYAKEAIQGLIADGVITGNNGRLNLSDNSTRAQMAQVIYNLLGK